MTSPLLFLSHAGRDIAIARRLRQRLLNSPDAQAAGLQVWLDDVDLEPGRPWLEQIEEVIQNQATGFAVMVGDGGIQNWVKPEADAAMSRAVKTPGFRFIPVLMDASSDQLSPFARRYHAVRNPLTDTDALQSLLRAALGTGNRRLHTISADDDVLSVAISGDGSQIVSGGTDGTLRLWGGATGAQIGESLRGHEGFVRSVAISENGRWIVSGGTNATLRLWDAATSAQIGEPLRGHEGEVRSVAISGDGTRIVSGGVDGTLRLWDVGYPKGNVFQIACQMLPMLDGTRDLSLAGLADVIGIEDLKPLADCEGYDPPLPDSIRR